MGILALEPDPQQWLTVPNENVEALKPPIEIEEQSKPSKLKAILPAVGIVITMGGMLMMIISRGRMIGTSLGTMSVGILGLASGSLAEFFGGEWVEKLKKQQEKYMLYITVKRRPEIHALQKHKYLAHQEIAPDPNTLLSLANTPLLFSRSPQSDCEPFGKVRAGLGVTRLTSQWEPTTTALEYDVDPLTHLWARNFIVTHRVIHDIPYWLNLTSFPYISFQGDTEKNKGFIRSVLLHVGFLYNPDKTKIMVIASAENQSDWDFVKWLPQCTHPSRLDSSNNPEPLLYDSLDAFLSVWETELASYPSFTPGIIQEQRYLIIILDIGVPIPEGILPPEGYKNICFLEVYPYQQTNALEENHHDEIFEK